MVPVLAALFAFVPSLWQSRWAMQLKIRALQHQGAVYTHTVPRPQLPPTDRLLWAWLSWLWPAWHSALAFVPPRTVIAWQRQRCRDPWRRLRQQGNPGRPVMAQEVRERSQAMGQAHPTWGSPRMVGERRKLGSKVAKATIEQDRVRPRKPPSPTWKTGLKTHAHDLVALACFPVPPVTLRGLFVRVILAHERRRVGHCNVTEHPTAVGTAPQVGDAFPWEEAPR